MLELLTGLVIVTLLVIGWGSGSIFACVFLSLPVLFLWWCSVTWLDASIAAYLTPGCPIALALIWLPALLRRRAY